MSTVTATSITAPRRRPRRRDGDRDVQNVDRDVRDIERDVRDVDRDVRGVCRAEGFADEVRGYSRGNDDDDDVSE